MDETDDGASAPDEAEAQREETVMPWFWGGVGLLLVAAFTAWLIFTPAQTSTRQPAAAAPLVKPPAQHP